MEKEPFRTSLVRWRERSLVNVSKMNRFV